MPLLYASGTALILWIAFRLRLHGTYEMDHGNGTKPGTFFPLLILYQVLAYFIAAASLTLSTFRHGVASDLFIAAAIDAAAFNAVTTLFYESFMHARYPGINQVGPSTYTASKYALVMALGFGVVALFVAGLVAK